MGQRADRPFICRIGAHEWIKFHDARGLVWTCTRCGEVRQWPDKSLAPGNYGPREYAVDRTPKERRR